MKDGRNKWSNHISKLSQYSGIRSLKLGGGPIFWGKSIYLSGGEFHRQEKPTTVQNFLVQGTAADILHLAVINIVREGNIPCHWYCP